MSTPALPPAHADAVPWHPAIEAYSAEAKLAPSTIERWPGIRAAYEDALRLDDPALVKPADLIAGKRALLASGRAPSATPLSPPHQSSRRRRHDGPRQAAASRPVFCRRRGADHPAGLAWEDSSRRPVHRSGTGRAHGATIGEPTQLADDGRQAPAAIASGSADKPVGHASCDVARSGVGAGARLVHPLNLSGSDGDRCSELRARNGEALI